MILKISQKINNCGWCKQIIIDFDNRAIKTGSYLFHSADINKISATQYKQTIDFFINQGFKNTEV